MISLALMLGALAGAAEEATAAAPWRFEVPPPGDPFEHPPLRALGLSTTRPDDVIEKVTYRGHRQRYAQLRYGSPNSIRVTVVLDEIGPGAADLYVDTNRNRRIEPRDKIRGEGRIWRVPLAASFVAGEETTEVDRLVVFRLGASGRTLSLAAAGYLEGSVAIGGRSHCARRTDGDADGSFTGSQDRIWIDLDDDGRWDPLAEQFLYGAILTIGPNRFAVRSDPQGTRLALEPLEGTGTIRLAIRRPETRTRLSAIRVLLLGRDGSALGLEGASGEVVAPVGEYRLSALSLSLTDPEGGPPWHFVFSEPYLAGRREPVWYKVEAGRVLELDPVARLELSAEIPEPPAERQPGAPVMIQPRLYTGDGLLINSGSRGAPDNPASERPTTARVELRSTGGATWDAATSGFS
ncbi:MAG: hypothetical protein IRY99_03150 [Isosphaeraceae bacterium]|nr:hypothetical protein [Isosphaeraceae bacterium]